MYPARFAANFFAQPLKQFKFQLLAAFLCVQDDFFLLLELGGNKAFRAGQGLFADPVGRYLG